jgi:hypothetical protein
MAKAFLISALALSLTFDIAANGATIVVGTAPLVHPAGGGYVGALHLTFNDGWWDNSHSGTLEGSGFAWKFEPEAFGEGLSKTFKIDNVFRPDLTKVMTITLKVRDRWMVEPGSILCDTSTKANCSNDFWPQVTTVINPAPFALIGASNLGYNSQEGVWSGQYQFSKSPQPAAEYLTFGLSDFSTFEVDVVSMEVLVSCVPEPATWATMILGFGVVGASLRRRRVTNVPA